MQLQGLRLTELLESRAKSPSLAYQTNQTNMLTYISAVNPTGPRQATCLIDLSRDELPSPRSRSHSSYNDGPQPQAVGISIGAIPLSYRHGHIGS